MKKKILLGVCGSIASYKACEVASMLTKQNFLVYTIITPGGLKFIRPLTFQALTGNPVYCDIFEQKFDTPHIRLAQDVDLIAVVPATASFISCLSLGICSDLLTLTILSSQKPVLICPAMNENLYQNEIVQDNIEKLKNLGYHFLGPEEGWLSCGYRGKGRLADPGKIVKKIKEILKEAK